VKIKICGITNIEDALLCQELGSDALGFIFYKNSKRYIKPDDAADIISALSPFTFKVGVFVNEPIENVRLIFETAKLNLVQLHGNEDYNYIKALNLPVIKSIRVKPDFDYAKLDEYPGTNFLFDNYSHDLFGGTGEAFNWNSIPANIRNKIILAGGISADNIEKVIKIINPLAVDISSSIESSPGKKDITKTKEFFSVLNKNRR
jgi:phosphoribosylanthranilate isomerase